MTGSGGGIYTTGLVPQAKTVIRNSLIANNNAAVGGGISAHLTGDLSIQGSQIQDNTATTSGGGIYLNGANVTATVTGGSLELNRAAERGRLYNDSARALTPLVKDNSAIAWGGGIHAKAGRLLSSSPVRLTTTRLLQAGQRSPGRLPGE